MDDVVQQAQAKGTPADQTAKLKDRLTQLSQGSAQPQTANSQVTQGKYGRKTTHKETDDSLQVQEEQRKKAIRDKIFGASLFSNANLTFEPNLNIATPGNYIIGPGDELDVEVFGYSEKSSFCRAFKRATKITPHTYRSLDRKSVV